MNIASLLFSAFWLYLPAMTANMAPVFASKLNILKSLNIAMDFGLKFHGEWLLGSHKTFRGLVVAIIAGGITGALQAMITQQDILFYFVIGAMLGLGAIVGDAIKSFFKRQLHVASGISWIPFDQIDFVIGATIFGMFFINISLPIFITAIIFIGCASYVVSFVGVVLHIKKSL